ncbi:MAG: hypothetical protein ACPLRA_03235 [Candidatus Saccharicenans sp.]
MADKTLSQLIRARKKSFLPLIIKNITIKNLVAEAISSFPKVKLNPKIKIHLGNPQNQAERSFLNSIRTQTLIAKSPEKIQGFSLLECLLSLSLSLLILISALEVFAQSRKVFNKLKDSQEMGLAAAIALEKIKEDLEIAGAGLPKGVSEEDFASLQLTASELIIFSKEEEIELASDINAGQSLIMIEPKSGLSSSLKKGRAIYLGDENKGQLAYVIAVSGNQLLISPAPTNHYCLVGTKIFLLEKVEIYLDSKQKILRRKVNDSSGQPLMEEVASFQFIYDPKSNLVQIRLGTEFGGKSHEHELVIYPKNLSKA